MALPNAREVEEGTQYQGQNEEITYTVDVSSMGTPSSPSATVYDTSDWSDVTSTVMPAGSASAAGAIITLPEIKSLDPDTVYRVFIEYTVGINIYENYFDLIGQR